MIKQKKAQMDLPFNWIFALILIVFFIATAVWAINHFRDLNQCSRVGFFLDDLQKKVDEAYSSSSYDAQIPIDLPGVERICFANLSKTITGSLQDYDQISIYDLHDANTFLIPPTKSCDMPYKKTKHIDIDATTGSKNPLCIDVSRGYLRLVKDYYSKGVVIK